MKYYIKTFGCAQNEADSERIAGYYESRGFIPAKSIKSADEVVINTCMIRASAEHRVYGLIHNLMREKYAKAESATGKKKGKKVKIIVTGCMTGMAVREKSGKMLGALKKKLPGVDIFLPIEEVGFDILPIRRNTHNALVPISNGCNNFCTYCVVPYTRGREVSRPMNDILKEVRSLAKEGIGEITLVGQNVNSYGADLRHTPGKVTYVLHLGRHRIPTLFPHLLQKISEVDGITRIDFISSNPWDFSDELIRVMATQEKISKDIHLALQSGDNEVLRRMNRWYTREDFLDLARKIKTAMPNARISTDIIVGFCGETAAQFEQTVDLAKQVGFSKAYVAMYSDRPMTAAHKAYTDDVPHEEKKRRWKILEELINKTNLQNGTYAKSIRYA